jgi:hypothetical protein
MGTHNIIIHSMNTEELPFKATGECNGVAVELQTRMDRLLFLSHNQLSQEENDLELQGGPRQLKETWN